MKKIFIILFVLMTSSVVSGAEAASQRDFPVKEHPRLFIDDQMVESAREAIREDGYWRKVDNFIINESAQLLKMHRSSRKVVGRRLLATSREVLCRVLYLSYTYKTTNNTLFAERAEKEMRRVAKFEDWNPSHFLDVAEMTAAMAIGYDWLYDYLSDESRSEIATAIIEKGLTPAINDDDIKHWNKNTNNWNQVCHTGLSLGAIAVMDIAPELSHKILNRAIENIQIPMANYNPNGAFAEGPTYWEYATVFNALFIEALNTAFGSDFGLLAANPGFELTSNYITQLTTPAGNLFNYGDNAQKLKLNIAPFWFAKQFGSDSVIATAFDLEIERQRLLPLALLWGHKFTPESVSKPSETFWVADGQTPVATMRSEWGNPNAQFVGVKLGGSTVSHSHLDVGSFIYESDGVRWATDMGGENYNKLETAGVDVWNRKQNSQRWEIYRYGVGQHNVYSLDGKNPNVDTSIKFDDVVRGEGSYSVAYDLTPSYTPTVANAYRKVEMIVGGDVVIDDKITTLDTAAKIDWSVVTEAKPSKVDGGVLLQKDGHSMLLTAEVNFDGGEWVVQSAVSPNKYDSANPGIYVVRYKANLKANAENSIVVRFIKQ